MSEPEMLTLTDDEGTEVPFLVLSRLSWRGQTYAILQEADPAEEPADDLDDGEQAVMVFSVTEEADGSETFAMVEDEDESDDVFYYWQADSEDYEFEDAV